MSDFKVKAEPYDRRHLDCIRDMWLRRYRDEIPAALVIDVEWMLKEIDRLLEDIPTVDPNPQEKPSGPAKIFATVENDELIRFIGQPHAILFIDTPGHVLEDLVEKINISCNIIVAPLISENEVLRAKAALADELGDFMAKNASISRLDLIHWKEKYDALAQQTKEGE